MGWKDEFDDPTFWDEACAATDEAARKWFSAPSSAPPVIYQGQSEGRNGISQEPFPHGQAPRSAPPAGPSLARGSPYPPDGGGRLTDPPSTSNRQPPQWRAPTNPGNNSYESQQGPRPFYPQQPQFNPRAMQPAGAGAPSTSAHPAAPPAWQGGGVRHTGGGYTTPSTVNRGFAAGAWQQSGSGRATPNAALTGQAEAGRVGPGGIPLSGMGRPPTFQLPQGGAENRAPPGEGPPGPKGWGGHLPSSHHRPSPAQPVAPPHQPGPDYGARRPPASANPKWNGTQIMGTQLNGAPARGSQWLPAPGVVQSQGPPVYFKRKGAAYASVVQQLHSRALQQLPQVNFNGQDYQEEARVYVKIELGPDGTLEVSLPDERLVGVLKR